VVVRIWDKRRLILPTTYFIQKPFQNWTRTSADILGTVFIYADYTLPVEELRKAFTSIIQKTDLWDGKVAVLQVTSATEKTMELRALMSAPDSPTAWDLRVLIREKLIEYLQKNFPDQLPRSRISLEQDS
jgi:small-conductance mechanosensitive channel